MKTSSQPQCIKILQKLPYLRTDDRPSASTTPTSPSAPLDDTHIWKRVTRLFHGTAQTKQLPKTKLRDASSTREPHAT